MHHQVSLGAIELITGISYLLILVGFALRQYLEGPKARLLWPWFLVSIFGLCGLTRLDYVGLIAAPDAVIGVFHLVLAGISLVYGVGQIVYACWPELFEPDTPMPQWALEEVDDTGPAEPVPTPKLVRAPATAREGR
jgi:hypothetical protein